MSPNDFAAYIRRNRENQGNRKLNQLLANQVDCLLGDSLRKSIDRGLANSRFGIVILSHAFFAKHWPQMELDGLVAREANGVKVVLPIWHGVTAAQVQQYSPLLLGRLAVSTDRGLDHVAQQVLQVLRPVRTEG